MKDKLYPSEKPDHYEVDRTANDIGMSHYMGFRDQMKVGADGQKLLRVVRAD